MFESSLFFKTLTPWPWLGGVKGEGRRQNVTTPSPSCCRDSKRFQNRTHVTLPWLGSRMLSGTRRFPFSAVLTPLPLGGRCHQQSGKQSPAIAIVWGSLRTCFEMLVTLKRSLPGACIQGSLDAWIPPPFAFSVPLPLPPPTASFPFSPTSSSVLVLARHACSPGFMLCLESFSRTWHDYYS